MGELRCTKCDREASYADANIADSQRTCGAEHRPGNVNKYGRAIGGEKHNWVEQ